MRKIYCSATGLLGKNRFRKFTTKEEVLLAAQAILVSLGEYRNGKNRQDN